MYEISLVYQGFSFRATKYNNIFWFKMQRQEILIRDDVRIVYFKDFLNQEQVNYLFQLAQRSLPRRTLQVREPISIHPDLEPLGATFDLGAMSQGSQNRYSELMIYKLHAYKFDVNSAAKTLIEGIYVFLGRARVRFTTGQVLEVGFGDMLSVLERNLREEGIGFEIESLSDEKFYMYRFLPGSVTVNGINFNFWLENVKGLYYDREFQGPEVCNLRAGLGVTNVDLDQEVTSPEDVEVYAASMGVNIQGKSQEELLSLIKQRAPCDWIKSIYTWAEQSPLSRYFNGYVSNDGMKYLVDYREGKKVDEAKNFFLHLNQAIYEAPRTNRSFHVYRGTSGREYKQGELTTLETPKSGTFGLTVINEGYLSYPESCCMMKIFIPRGAPLGYHPSEDQVIFPSGARLYIVSGPTMTQYELKIPRSDGTEFKDLKTYYAVYVDAPDAPIDVSLQQSVEAGVSGNLYLERMTQDAPFPYRA